MHPNPTQRDRSRCSWKSGLGITRRMLIYKMTNLEINRTPPADGRVSEPKVNGEPLHKDQLGRLKSR
jgi:hypothetical protein